MLIARNPSAVLIALSPGLLSCHVQEEPCRPYVRKGDAIEVAVVGKEDTARSAFLDLPPCSLDDVSVGDRLRLEIGAPLMTNDTCYDFACPADLPVASEPLGASVRTGSLNYLCLRADRKIQIAEACEAGRFVALYAPLPVESVYAPAAADGSTAVHMVRALTSITTDGAALDCAAPPSWAATADRTQKAFFCADAWRVELTKIE